MSYNSDRPILEPAYDRLGRESFSKLLGEAICNYQGNASIVIGLYGEWGSGKTSIINMALKTVGASPNNPVVFKFAPWNYVDKENLIGIFFNELQSIIKLDKNKEFKRSVGKALRDYADIIDVATYIPVFGFALAPTLKSIAKISGEVLSKPKDLNTSKNKLSEALQKSNRKIVVVIDDIDRLNNSQIQDMFQLVKQVGDLPNIIYVLAMDRDIVANALSDIQNSNGMEYLKKIIQIPFEIPPISSFHLYSCFFAEVNTVINEMFPEKTIDHDLFLDIYKYCVAPYFRTLRDVHRIINVFRFRVSLLCFLLIEDLVGITALEVLNPKLYIWIRNNKSIVCNKKLLDADHKSKDDKKTEVKMSFEKMGLDPETSCNAIAILFPDFGKAFGITSRIVHSNYRKFPCIELSDETSFDSCFAFNLDVNRVSNDDIHNFAYLFGEQNIKEYILCCINDGQFDFFAKEFQLLMCGIPFHRLNLIASAIINNASDFETVSCYPGPNYWIATKLVYDIMCQFKYAQDLVDLFNPIFETCNDSSFRFLSSVLCKILSETEISIRKEFVSRITLLYIEKAKEILQTVDISQHSENLSIFKVWKKIYEKSFLNYYNKTFKSDFDKLKLMCLCFKHTENSLYVHEKNIMEFFSFEEINSLIERTYFNDNIISKLSDREKDCATRLRWYCLDKQYFSDKKNRW